MYDGRTNPGRNDECWCGSGKKYKKCHLDFDERLQSMYEQGFELPDRASLKSAADIEGIKRSAAINIGARPPRKSTAGCTTTRWSTAASRPT